MSIYEPPKASKTSQNPSQIQRTSLKKRCPKTHEFSRCFYIDFSRFSTSKSMIFWTHFACRFQASAKSAKPEKHQFSLGKIDIFKGSSIETNVKMHQKSHQKGGYEKETPKTTPKIDFGSHFGLQNLSKIEEKTSKNDVKKKTRKKGPKKCQQDPAWKSTSLRPGSITHPPSLRLPPL